MELYKNNHRNLINSNLNTKISITIRGDGSEIFDYNLPTPHTYTRATRNKYTIEYYLYGDFFCTGKAGKYLNDILARFTLSMDVIEAKAFKTCVEPDVKPIKMYDNNQFNSLRSIQKFKYKETIDNGKDNVFWALKFYLEDCIKESAGGMVAYSLLEYFAFAHFVERTKDRSTLKGKCRSIWNWYDKRDWTIPKRYERTLKEYLEETKMTRSEHMMRVTKERADKNRAIVINCITGLMANEYKKKSGSWHYGKICEATKLSPNTVKKYIKEFEEKEK
jgi:hypothetical protein